MPLITAKDFPQLFTQHDNSGLVRGISQAFGYMREDMLRKQAAEAAKMQEYEAGKARSFVFLAGKPMQEQDRILMRMAQDAAKQGLPTDDYMAALDIIKQDERDLFFAQKAAQAGVKRDTVALASDAKLVDKESGAIVAKNPAEEDVYTFVKDIPIGGGQYRAGYVSKQPGTDPVFTSEPYEKKALINQNIDLGPKLPTGFQWKDPANPAAGVVPIEGGPADPAVIQQNEYDKAINVVNATASSLSRYRRELKKYGTKIMPSAAKQGLSTAYKDIQLELKELFNLGVLNGPDLDLIEQYLTDPTSITGNLYELFGGIEGFEAQFDLIDEKIEAARERANELYGSGKPSETGSGETYEQRKARILGQ